MRKVDGWIIVGFLMLPRHVLTHRPRRRELLPTDFAYVRSLTGVGAAVPRYVARVADNLTAFAAPMQRWVVVNASVLS